MARPDTAASERHGQITVHRIETEPMTGQQRGQAVRALATLIQAWSASDLTGGRANYAVPLPLSRTRSDTDHADGDPATRHRPSKPAEGTAHDPHSQPAGRCRRRPAV